MPQQQRIVAQTEFREQIDEIRLLNILRRDKT